LPQILQEESQMKLVAFALSLLVSCAAFAQGYPAKPVKVVVPYAAGGLPETMARLVGQKLGDSLGQQMVIENRAGAGGIVGTNEVAKAAPDGYTLLMVFDTHAVNHHIFKMAPDPFKELEHISLMVTSPSALVAVTSFAPSSIREIVAYAKANPEKVTYSTAGSGSSNHLAALLFEQFAGVRLTHVAYKGGGPMVQALLGQQVNITFMSMPLILPHIKSGKVKGIATGGKTRAAQLPDLPTFSEAYPGFEQISWFGILGPRGLPKQVSTKVHGEMTRALRTPEAGQRLTEQGFDIVASSPQEFFKFVQGESDKLGKLIRDNKIVAE
jgi:tripartite-type tricarboxylate transporter receptor subunit TctC